MRAVLEMLGWGLLGVVGILAALFLRVSVAGGGSMEPALVHGDVCLVLKDPQISEGDIVLYRRPGEGAVLHRVVSIEAAGRLRTRGDANPVPDLDPVPSACVAGRVVGVFPLGRAFRGWMRSLGDATLLVRL